MTVDRIDSDLISRLIRIGRSEDPAAQLLRMSRRLFWATDGHIMRLHWSQWNRAVRDLDAEDLAALVRALTVAEHTLPGWGGGSVSAAIWTFRQYRRRFPERAHALADWCLANTQNPNVPFGTHNFGAQSLNQLEQARRRYDAKRARIQQAEQARADAGRARRAEKATMNLFNAVRRGDAAAVAALLAKGADPMVPSDGITPLELARTSGREDLVELLTTENHTTGSPDAPQHDRHPS